MKDGKLIISPIDEYEILVYEVLVEGMKMCEYLQASVLLEKLPLS